MKNPERSAVDSPKGLGFLGVFHDPFGAPDSQDLGARNSPCFLRVSPNVVVR